MKREENSDTRVRTRWRVLFVVLACAPIACSLIVDTSGLTGGGDGGSLVDSGTVTTNDASTDSSAVDAAIDSSIPKGPDGGCAASAPFTTVTRVDAIDVVGVDDLAARLSHDELTVYFVSTRSGAFQTMYSATRATTTDAFGTPTQLSSITTTADDFAPMPAQDQLTLFFDSAREGGAGGRDIYFASRLLKTAAFANVTPASALNTAEDDGRPYLVSNDLVLYYTTAPSGADQIYRATRVSTAAQFSAGSAVAEVNTAGDNYYPTASQDETLLYFTSDRAGGAGDTDIYYVTRGATSLQFSAPTRVPELATAFDDQATWLSDDRCRLYFHSDRTGDDDVYVAERSP